MENSVGMEDGGNRGKHAPFPWGTSGHTKDDVLFGPFFWVPDPGLPALVFRERVPVNFIKL